MTAQDSKKIKVMKGTVVSDVMDKTIVVEVSRVKTHPLYSKKYSVTSKFKAHDAENSCKIGDKVDIAPCRPFSREKKYIVVKKTT